MSTTATRIGTISLVCLPTPDQDRAIAFYESLGFELCMLHRSGEVKPVPAKLVLHWARLVPNLNLVLRR